MGLIKCRARICIELPLVNPSLDLKIWFFRCNPPSNFLMDEVVAVVLNSTWPWNAISPFQFSRIAVFVFFFSLVLCEYVIGDFC